MNSGTVIASRYTVKKIIGRGGMQDVYLATDELLGTNVALKTPQVGQVDRRFKQSAIVAAMVNHHNVAKTLDYVEELEKSYLIEELVEGETLEEKISRFKVVDPHLASRILHHLAKGVAASHHAGVVHRDLKPSNVMVAAGVNLQDLKITDFGIATLTEAVFEEAARGGDLTRSTSGTIRGALPYMAPEMMFRQPGEHPSTPLDIWSVGAMMFRLLTGEYPFGVYLEAAVNVKNGTRRPWPNFMTSNPQFSPLAIELQQIVDSCLQYDAFSRPTADQLVQICSQLCYNSSERYEGTINCFIQNGYSAFIDGEKSSIFASMESVYGNRRPDLAGNRTVTYSTFPGFPSHRAHPLLVIG
jgi:serine/threonine-protein kinase